MGSLKYVVDTLRVEAGCPESLTETLRQVARMAVAAHVSSEDIHAIVAEAIVQEVQES
jgi:hypothetical protein